MSPRSAPAPDQPDTEARPRRSVGRPRHYDDDVERQLIIDSAYALLRDDGTGFTISTLLHAAGVATRSFYRHLPSKDALLCALYRRDAEWAAERIERRLAEAPSPVEAIEHWVDEIFGFVRVSRRAERVAVLGSITAASADGAPAEAAHARELLTAPLRAAIESGVDDGTVTSSDPATDADLVAAAVLHAAGLDSSVPPVTPLPQRVVVAFCRRALGIDVPG